MAEKNPPIETPEQKMARYQAEHDAAVKAANAYWLRRWHDPREVRVVR